MASSRRIKISSTSDIQAEYYSQKIVNHNTGKTKIVDNSEPQHWTRSATVIGNPGNPENYEAIAKSKGKPLAKEVPVRKLGPVVEGFDTSQL